MCFFAKVYIISKKKNNVLLHFHIHDLLPGCLEGLSFPRMVWG